MALTTAAVITAGAAAYGAYNSKRTGDQAMGLAGRQASRQQYYDELLRDLMKNPSQILKDPGYQLSFDQGMQAVARSNAAKGFLDSGNAAIELQRFGQSFSSTYLRQQEQLLAALSGAQFNPASAIGTGQQSYNDSFAQFGQALANLGYTFGGAGGGTNASSDWSAFGYSQGSVPGTGVTDSGYIVNLPGG